MTTAAVPDQLRAVMHPTDLSAASELAFAHALRVALNARGKFYILHTEQAEPEEIDWAAFPGVRSMLAKWRLLEAGSPPEAVFERLGVKIRKTDIVGQDPVHGIARFFERHPSDLIVLATHGREGWQRWLQGSVAEAVAREVRAPALFLPHGARGFVDAGSGEVSLRRVLMPVDREPRPEAAAVVAAALMRALGAAPAELFLLHVGAPADAPAVQLEERAWSRVERLARQGGVVETIAAVAAELSTDLVVMATQGHRGFLDALRGSTTEQVLRRSSRPVLAVPAG